ncbi:uncharacterized protein G2W53_018409 [Senna tora]|uniref:Uncharacterized protein n=1 Tax=Senna tora TaxID=362788 RepID=A0A834TVW3_9FABA|nr:uncharacterized protein G2W53_018409 [Senna tora]
MLLLYDFSCSVVTFSFFEADHRILFCEGSSVAFVARVFCFLQLFFAFSVMTQALGGDVGASHEDTSSKDHESRYEREWRTKVASKMPIDLSRVRQTSPFDAHIEKDLLELSKKGAIRLICRVPKEYIPCGNKDSLLAGFQLHCHHLWVPPIVKLFSYFYQLGQRFMGRPWHFARATRAPAIFKGIESKLRGWQESFIRVVPFRSAHPSWLDRKGYPLFPLIRCDSGRLPSVGDEDLTLMELKIVERISRRIKNFKNLSSGLPPSSLAAGASLVEVSPITTLEASNEEVLRKGKSKDTTIGDDADELGEGDDKEKKKITGDFEPDSSSGRGSLYLFRENLTAFNSFMEKVVSPTDSAQLTSILGKAEAPSRLERSCLELLCISVEHQTCLLRHNKEKQVWDVEVTNLKKEKGDQEQQISEMKKEAQKVKDDHFIPLENALYMT